MNTRPESARGRHEPDRLLLFRDSSGLVLRLRELRVGEWLRSGDLWSDGVALHVVEPVRWWRPRRMGRNHCRHYRISA